MTDSFEIVTPVMDTLVIEGPTGWVLMFTADGKVRANPEIEPDEAARRVIDVIRHIWPESVAQKPLGDLAEIT